MDLASYSKLLAGSLSYKFRVRGGGRPRQRQVTFLTSSDSRIDPCALTDTPPGDLFVIRNLGNIVPEAFGCAGEVAALEYAVEVLATEHIIVCGHSDCGAMQALLSPGACAHLPQVSTWVRQSLEALIALEGTGADPAARLDRLIAANVLLQLENLRQLDFVREAEKDGRLQLHGWFCDLETGDVRELAEQSSERFQCAA